MSDHRSESGATPVHDDPRAAAKAQKAYDKAMRPWYKKKRILIPIALVVLVIIIAAASGGSDGGPEVVGSDGDTSASDSGDPDKPGSKSDPIAVGETVELQGTRYTVESAKTKKSVGDEFFQEKANGTYVVVSLTIENKKDETKTFSDEAAKLVGSNDKKYSTDTDGTVAAIGNGDDSLIFEDMQPDVPKTGTLVYDVPKKLAKGSVLEVSDLFGRGEAYIDLGL